MASINTWTFSGILTSDAQDRTGDGAGGFCALFHLHVSCGNGAHAWAAVYWRGNKAADAFDDLVKGALVVVEGAIGPRDEVQPAAILVNARNVFTSSQMEVE